MDLSETLQKIRDGFLEKSADLEALQMKSDDQVKWDHIKWGRGLRAASK